MVSIAEPLLVNLIEVESPQARSFIGRGLVTERRTGFSDEILTFIFQTPYRHSSGMEKSVAIDLSPENSGLSFSRDDEPFFLEVTVI